MLCGFDQKYCSDKYNEASAHNGSKSNRPINSGTGVGYGSGGFLGMFGRPQGQQSYAEDAGKKTAETAERRSDRFDQMIFSFLAVLCPSPGNDHNDDGPLGSFDIQPPKAVASMLVHSKILAKAAELLRNDSLENVTQRSDLYMALIRFLKRVGVHSISKQEVMYTDRVVFPDTVNLLTLALKSTTAGTASTASPLAECLRKLNLQSSMMIRNAQRLRTEFTDVRGQDMLWLCREISDLSSHLCIEQWWTSRRASNSDVLDHGIVEVPDADIECRYILINEARALRQSPPGRIRRLITEITSLKTGLSSGIYVKHAISRPDMMKILIVGPEGTPYENGLFEFDLFCPREYPQVPPQVRFRHPQGCHLSFNPNLHTDGEGEYFRICEFLIWHKLTISSLSLASGHMVQRSQRRRMAAWSLYDFTSPYQYPSNDTLRRS
ncbi:hypothetical protein ACJQWK_10644 [Exserohilum turcicum]